MQGYVYILSNPSIPELLKIGYTTTSLKQRIQELSSSTGVAEPFHLEGYCESVDPVDDERVIHQQLDSYRYSKNREFFKISVLKASRTLEFVCKTKASFSLPSNKNRLKTDATTIKASASSLFSNQKSLYVKKILTDLPKVNYRKNGENNDSYIIYGWSPFESKR
ncbi:GIY-YIG nuclease family protein [Alkalimarinus coralli]|uniref:GIY-YIG nuclease family protein n=1 Tax=Alkalimarinus coralli TaxID=2935863 RepID=UPI00202B7F29|nr:GIY-YIG nuclease family protein [Alkalimarinus coralli]